MRFLHPAHLHWLWLALAPIALWLFRRKAKRVPVSTLLFFRLLAREHQESAWLRRLKRLLSLLLSLAVMALAAVALARPFARGGGDVPRSLVIVLDRSASMSSVDDSGRTRLAEAKSLLKGRLRALPENVVTSLVVYDMAAEVAQSRSTNRRELLRLLDQVAVSPVEDRPEEAIAVARRLAALDPPAEIWLAGDRPQTDLPGFEPAESGGATRVRAIPVGAEAASNIGIIGFRIRPAPLARNRFDVFVEVGASAANGRTVEATVEARLDGRPVQLRQVEIGPGASAKLILPIEGGKGQRLEMEARCEGDRLGWDNAVAAPLPDLRPLVVAWFTEKPDPFIELALTSMLSEERIQMLKGGSGDFPPKDRPDVYVFENWLPKDWPTDRPVLALNPPSDSGPVRARRLDRGVPYDAVRAVRPEHPVLYRVASGRVALTQTTAINVSETLDTLWMAGQEPVLAAGEASGQRVVVAAFVPGRSEQLALMPALPLLIGNSIYWCAENNDSLSALKPRRPGEIVPMVPGLVKWLAWDGGRFVTVADESQGGWFGLRRCGIFEGPDGKTESCLLLSARETGVQPQPAPRTPQAVSESGAMQWSAGGGWWTTLLWLVAAVLMAESWLFHREAVY